MSKPFHEVRRQNFLTQSFYAFMSDFRTESISEYRNGLQRTSNGPNDFRRLTLAIASERYELLSLHYTAGESIELLRSGLTAVVDAYESYQKALQAYEQIPQIAPLGLGDLTQYERCMQLIGLCYLLHRRDLLPRIVALEDPAYAGQDAFYEDFLAYGFDGRYDTDEMLHLDVYDPLIHAMYTETDEESVDDIRRYVRDWYPHFKYAPWHDGHLRIEGTQGDYFGYWAFEAGAVAYLLDLDDSTIDHMVYPKDLVAWARAHRHLSDESSGGDATTRLRCDANQPCPREGWWFTPAQARSRRHFKTGEPMPELNSAYGLTIWQWDEQQGPAAG